jgi:glycine betaine/proline transport system ATP-binding protein
MSGIEVKYVNRRFGTHEASWRALGLLRGGASEAEVLEKTPCNVGLNDVSLSIDLGQILHQSADDYVSRFLERRAQTTR